MDNTDDHDPQTPELTQNLPQTPMETWTREVAKTSPCSGLDEIGSTWTLRKRTTPERERKLTLENTPRAKNTKKLPGGAYVPKGADSITKKGEIYRSVGENGRGKLITTKATLGPHKLDEGITETDGKEHINTLIVDVTVVGT